MDTKHILHVLIEVYGETDPFKMLTGNKSVTRAVKRGVIDLKAVLAARNTSCSRQDALRNQNTSKCRLSVQEFGYYRSRFEVFYSNSQNCSRKCAVCKKNLNFKNPKSVSIEV